VPMQTHSSGIAPRHKWIDSAIYGALLHSAHKRTPHRTRLPAAKAGACCSSLACAAH
jgi:hypothetical protein